MQTNMRKTAILGGLEPGESTVCTTFKLRFHSLVPVLFALVLGFMLIGCGGGDGDDVFTVPGEENGGNGGEIVDEDGVAVVVTDLRVLASSGETLTSAEGSTLRVSALVLGEGNKALANVPVRFELPDEPNISWAPLEDASVNSSGLPLTDASGRVEARLTMLDDPRNRTFTVRAVVGSLSGTRVFQVDGTRLRLTQFQDAFSVGITEEIAVTLEDSLGRPAAGQPVEVDQLDGDSVQIEQGGELVTDANGEARFKVAGVAEGQSDIAIRSAGAATFVSLLVATDLVTIEAPTRDALLPISEQHDVAARWLASQVPVSGQPLTVSVSRGDLGAAAEGEIVENTNAEGRVSSTLTSDIFGPVQIIARTDAGASGSAWAFFVADTPDRVDVQAFPSTVRVNTPGSDTNRSRVVATVRDSDRSGEDEEGNKVEGPGNAVANARVRFRIMADPSGGRLSSTDAVTDRFGRAEVDYIAGELSSGENGVRIEAVVQGTEIADETTLTVRGDALNVAFGTGNVLIEDDGNVTRYRMPFEVFVSDAAGQPVSGAVVDFSLWSESYAKGFYTVGLDTWFPVRAPICPSEDHDRTGIITDAKDVTDSGTLIPGNVAVVSPGLVTTDDEGSARFAVLYPRSSANWVRVDLSAAARVEGTEGAANRVFWLPALIDDLALEVTPPGGLVSEYGSGLVSFDDPELADANLCTSTSPGREPSQAELGFGFDDPPLVITTDSLPPATAEVAYQTLLNSSGGSTDFPNEWTLVSNGGAAGLALTSTGATRAELSWGNPVAGSYDIIVEVNDGLFFGGQTASKTLTLQVIP